jgi:hypothetical protein
MFLVGLNPINAWTKRLRSPIDSCIAWFCISCNVISHAPKLSIHIVNGLLSVGCLLSVGRCDRTTDLHLRHESSTDMFLAVLTHRRQSKTGAG